MTFIFWPHQSNNSTAPAISRYQLYMRGCLSNHPLFCHIYVRFSPLVRQYSRASGARGSPLPSQPSAREGGKPSGGSRRPRRGFATEGAGHSLERAFAAIDGSNTRGKREKGAKTTKKTKVTWRKLAEACTEEPDAEDRMRPWCVGINTLG